MHRLLTGIAVLLLALCVVPAFAADDKDKKDPAPDAKKDSDNKDATPPVEKPIKVGVVTGKLVEVNESAKSIKVEVTTQVQKPNVGELQALQNCEIQLQQAAYKCPPDYNQIASLQQQILQHKANSVTMEKKTSNVDYTATDDVKVRLAEPPPAFDDKGNVKKRTNKELAELKGDPKDPDSKLPGYPGAFSDLHQGAMVQVTLVKKKDAPHTGPKPKDADPDVKQDNLPQASMIEIYPEPPGK